MLEIQKYLRSGKTLDNLNEELGIISNEYENLAALNYSQIDSPKSHPIVMECRGLIIEKDSWEVVCYPFRRFFNYGEIDEITKDFNFSNAVGLQKIDGSLISVFYHKDKWYMATRGCVNNPNYVSFNTITFKELFDKIVEQYDNFYDKLDKIYTYTFELVSLENRVVTIYNERKLFLLSMREQSTLIEQSFDKIKEQSAIIGIEMPYDVDFNSCGELIELAEKLNSLEEGFVAIDYSSLDEDGISYKRVKVKNSSYVAIHHLKNNISSIRSIVRLVMKNEENEFLSYFPEFKDYIKDVRIKYDEFMNQINIDEKQIKPLLLLDRNPENKKEFALHAVKSKMSAYLFELYKGRITNIQEYFDNQIEMKGSKYIEKFLVDKMKLKDVSFEITE